MPPTYKDVTVNSVKEANDDEDRIEVVGTIDGLYPPEAYFTHYEPNQLIEVQVDEEGHTELRPKPDAVGEQRLRENARLQAVSVLVHKPPSYEDYTETHRHDLLAWAKQQLINYYHAVRHENPDGTPITPAESQMRDLRISG